MVQMMFLIVNVVLLFFIMYNNYYKDRKQREYKNDERWQVIQNRADKIINKYYELLIVVVAIGVIMTTVVSVEMYLSLQRALSFAFMAIASRNVVEVLALRIYNSRI